MKYKYDKSIIRQQEAEQKEITIYWWNIGEKTLDFKGTYKDFLIEKDIKVSKIKHPFHKKIDGYRFTVTIGSSTIRVNTFDYSYVDCCINLIKLFLTYLGDKSIFNDSYNKEHKINWR